MVADASKGSCLTEIRTHTRDGGVTLRVIAVRVNLRAQIQLQPARICEQPPRVPDVPDPPRKNYAFKPKEFERLNAPRPEAPDAHSPGPSTATPPPAANDVFAIQRQLREREIAAGMDELAAPDRPVSRRRKRDYWLLMFLTNGVLIPLALWGYRTGNAVLFVYAIAGLALVNVALVWVMWFLMDDY